MASLQVAVEGFDNIRNFELSPTWWNWTHAHLKILRRDLFHLAARNRKEMSWMPFLNKE